MKRFILLLNHDDRSLSDYLQHCLERGEQLVSASGNIFTFKKTEPCRERIAAVTYTSENPDLKMKFEMEDYAALMKKRGWRVLSVGKPENIFDSRRHVFLQTDQPDPEMPVSDPKLAEKAAKRERHSLIRCFVMLLLLLGFGIFFLSHDPDVFLSSNHILIMSLVCFVFGIVSFVYCIRGAVTLIRKAQSANGFRDYLHVDRAVFFCMTAVGALLAALVLDLFFFPDTSRTMVKGDQRVTVYQDAVPLSLNDLSMPMKGAFHSSRLTERKGWIMRSTYGYDQSFSDPNGTADLSLLSYSVYRSEWKAGLDWVSAKKGYADLPESPELAERWKGDAVRTDGIHRLAVRYPDALLVLSTSENIGDIDPAIVLEKLLP